MSNSLLKLSVNALIDLSCKISVIRLEIHSNSAGFSRSEAVSLSSINIKVVERRQSKAVEHACLEYQPSDLHCLCLKPAMPSCSTFSSIE